VVWFPASHYLSTHLLAESVCSLLLGRRGQRNKGDGGGDEREGLGNERNEKG
jgi:hypothetical protein